MGLNRVRAFTCLVGLLVCVIVLTTGPGRPAKAQDFTIAEMTYGNWMIYAYAENGVFSHCGVDTVYPQSGRTLGLQVRSWGFDMVLVDPQWRLPQGSLGSAYLQIGRFTTYAQAEVSGSADTVFVDLGWSDPFLDAFARSQSMSVVLPNGSRWAADLTGTARLVSLLDDCIHNYRDFGR